MRAWAMVIGLGSAVACTHTPKSPPEPKLAESAVIDLVRGYLAKQSASTTVEERVCKTVPRTQRVPCEKRDLDFEFRCSGTSGPGAPYGYKTVTGSETVCGVEKVTKPGACASPPRDGKWTATYSEAA